MNAPRCIVGVMAHDEEPTIATALDAILTQVVVSAEVTDVVIVSSGSTDGTDEIVRAIAARDARVHLIIQPERRGKIDAVNYFLAHYPADLYVLCNADVILEHGALEALLQPLVDPRVGMSGGRVIPRVNLGRGRGFFDFANHVLWEIHHRLVLEQPKMGEAVAFRPFVRAIPSDLVADEAFLEATAHDLGLRVVYVPEARFSAGCPTTFGEYFEIRRRNTAAHQLLKLKLGYEVATLTARPILKVVRQIAAAHVQRTYRNATTTERAAALLRDVHDAIWFAAVVALEAGARTAGRIDARWSPARHRVWRMARSARRPLETVG